MKNNKENKSMQMEANTLADDKKSGVSEEKVLENEMSENQKHKTFHLSKFLPNAVTITAMCFGLTSIKFALSNEWEYAVLCIFVSSLLDMCDGKVARLLRQSSPFGMQLDSLSDLVCFGVAPAIILYLMSMSYAGKAGWAICLFFAVCCAMRLARFNVSHVPDVKLSELDIKYFTGVPAPAGAILALFPMILFFATEKYCFLSPHISALFLLVSGVLMVSTLRTVSSKMFEVDRDNAWMALTGVALIIIFLITDLWLTLSVLISLYILSLPIGVYFYNRAVNNQKI